MKPAERPTRGMNPDEAPAPGAEMELKEMVSHKGVERKLKNPDDPLGLGRS